ncbi:hypothetical protein Pint_21763 [Pistacia integerrima]|uniref:Uncharacterized protein n=1 Tax=Pistacia integerrima TaxID=434235 RepID=A0ACC0XDP2_9ROSI|nr:hypothetical protein Pint_21763 [Pistacia integerrima]
MSSNDGNIQKLKFFTENELEKATDSYNETRILGQGGQGTVYKGMLEEGRIIAVKRLKKVAERVDVFINEDGKEEEIIVFANLTERCLKLNGRKRPTMREVTTKLAGIRISIGASILKQNCEEGDYVDGDINSQLKASSSFTGSFFE